MTKFDRKASSNLKAQVYRKYNQAYYEEILIDYNVDILSPAPACERLAVAVQPCLLTPAQAALAHALGTVQGRVHALPS